MSAAVSEPTVYPITPVPKPRQTQADRWKKRPAVLRYRAFADECRQRGVWVPVDGCHVVFRLPMPRSWSKRKRAEVDGLPHMQKPDLDNLLKSLMDAVHPEDCLVWRISGEKRWADQGSIEVQT